jgi:PKD repeat protein
MNMHMQKVAIIILILFALLISPVCAATLTNYTVGTTDGWMENGTTQTWAAIRNGTGNYATTSSTGMRIRAGASTTSNQYTELDRLYVQFDTSSIPDTSIITGAIVYLYGSTISNTFVATPWGAALFGYTPTTYGTGVQEDFSLGGTIAYSNFLSNTTLVSGAYNPFTISNLTYINKTGYTAFMGKLNLDANGTAPTWESGKIVSLYFETAEQTHDPYIVVTYTAVPTTDFTGAPLSGFVPHSVTFTDTSSNTPTAWAWYKQLQGGGSDTLFSTSQNPTESFTVAGLYNIKLYSSNAAGGSWQNATSYVSATTPAANFVISSTNGYAPYTVSFTDTSTGSPTGWKWYYRNTDGGSDTLFSTSQNPTNTFTSAGSYDIKLNTSYASSNDWENQTDRILIYNMTAGVTSKSVTLTYHSANGITWWEYGVSPTNLPFKTRNVTGTGVVTTTVSGLPLLSGQTYYFRACTVSPYECTDTSSVVLASVTPNPETTYGMVEQNISSSQFNMTELGPSLFEPFGWATGQSSSIAVGIIMFFVMVAFWIRGRGVVIPIILGFIVSFLIISGAAYGTSIPPEFVLGGMIFASLGLTGITLMLFKR